MATKKIEIETIIQPVIKRTEGSQELLQQQIKDYSYKQTEAVTRAFQDNISQIVNRQIKALEKEKTKMTDALEKMTVDKKIQGLQNIASTNQNSNIPLMSKASLTQLKTLSSKDLVGQIKALETKQATTKLNNSEELLLKQLKSQEENLRKLENKQQQQEKFIEDLIKMFPDTVQKKAQETGKMPTSIQNLIKILKNRNSEYENVQDSTRTLTEQWKKIFDIDSKGTSTIRGGHSYLSKSTHTTSKNVTQLIKEGIGDTATETQIKTLTKSTIGKVNYIFRSLNENFEKIKQEAENSESAEREIYTLKQQIIETIVAETLRDFKSTPVSVPGRSSKASYYEEGIAKDKDLGVLTTRTFKSGVIDGKFVPSSYIDENGQRRDNRTIAVKSNRLINPDNILGLGNLSNASITQLQQAYEKIENIPNPTQKVIDFAEEIIQSIVEAINNTEDGPIKQALISQLSGTMKESYEESQNRFLSDLTERKNTFTSFNKSGTFYDRIRGEAYISASTAPTIKEVGRLETGEGQPKQDSRNEAGALRERLVEITKAAEQFAIANPMVKAELEALGEELGKLESKTKISQEDLSRFAELLEITIQHMIVLKDERAESRLIEQGEKEKYGDAYKSPAYILDKSAYDEDSNETVLDRKFGRDDDLDETIDDTSIEENIEDAIQATEDLTLEAKETILALKQALGTLADLVDSNLGVNEVTKEKGIKTIAEFTANLDKFDEELAQKFSLAIPMLEEAIQGEGSLTNILMFLEQSNSLIQEMYAKAEEIPNDTSKDSNQEESINTSSIKSGTAKRTIISSQSLRDVEDDTVTFLTDSLKGLLDRVRKLSIDGATEIANNSDKFASRVENVNQFYNTIANFLNYADVVDISLQQFAKRLEEITGTSIDIDELRKQFVAENPEMGNRYIQSMAAKTRFEEAGGISNIDSAMEAFFNSNDELIIRYKNSWDKLVDDIVTVGEEGVDNFVESGQSLVKRNLVYRLDPKREAENPNAYEGRVFYSKAGIQGQKIPDEIFEKSSHSMRTQLAYRAGYTGARYGGYTPEENLDNARVLLKQKQKEVKESYEDETDLLDAEIKLIREDIKILESAVKQRPVEQVQAKDTRSAKSKRKAERKKLIQQELQKKQQAQKEEADKRVQEGLAQEDLIGDIITHKAFGKGTIVSQENGIISVKFESDKEPRKFLLDNLSHFITDYEKIQKSQQEEQKALQETADIASGEHTKGIEQATEAEKAKIVVSEKLADTLEKEKEKHEEVTEAAKEEAKAVEDANQQQEQSNNQLNPDINNRWSGKLDSIEGFIPEYDAETHTYRKRLADGSYESVMSSTQARDALYRGINPTFGADLNRIKNAAKNASAENPLTTSSVGMNDEKEFNFLVDVIASGLRGDLFHHLVDILSTYDDAVQSLEDLENLVKQGDIKAQADLKDYQSMEQDIIAQLNRYGLGQDYLGIENRLASYMNAYNQARDRFGISRTAFSERQLGLTFKGSRGNINIGVTPDQLYSIGDTFSSERIGAVFDSKTGKVKGYEALQLSTQALAIYENLDKIIDEVTGTTVRDLVGDVNVEKIRLFIANVGENYTEFIEYMRLSSEELYNAFMNAHDVIHNGAMPLSEREKSMLNRQLQSGRIVGSSGVEEVNQDITGDITKDKKIINDYVAFYKKQQLLIVQITEETKKLKIANDNDKVAIEQKIKALENEKKAIEDLMPDTDFGYGAIDENGRQRITSAIFDNHVIDENNIDYLDARIREVDAFVARKGIDASVKTQNKDTEYELALIRKYIDAQDELNKLKKQENNIILKQNQLDKNIDKDEWNRLEQEKQIIGVRQWTVKRKKDETWNAGLTVDLETRQGKMNGQQLVIENANYLRDELLRIEQDRLAEERRFNQQQSEEKIKQEKQTAQQEEEQLKKSKDRYLALLKERHNAELEILKLEGDNAVIDRSTEMGEAKWQDNSKLIAQYKDQISQTTEEFEKLEQELRDIDALNDDVFRVENNRFDNKKLETENANNEKVRKYEIQNQNLETKQVDQDIKTYLNNYKKQLEIEREIERQRERLNNVVDGEKKNTQDYINLLNRQKTELEAMIPKYDEQARTMNGILMTDQQIVTIEQGRTKILNDHEAKMAKQLASYKQQIPLLDQLVGSLKNIFQNVSLYNIMQRAFNSIEGSIRQVITSAKELDSALVDIQIASGMSRGEVNEFMYDLNRLGNELGMTTQEMASASNDWLRAGYEGKEAMELTRASASLAQLGMINTSDATSYLISSLKGWKLEAEDVMRVVDKLSAVDMSAAISAGDLAEAMSRANNSAQLAGISMDRYIGLLTVGADVTQRAPESIGQAWNTLIARLGNVKADKFVASQEDLDSENYNEDEFESLNDVEKVLDSVGIKLRENYGTWKETEEVIDEIAQNWSKWDKTTQNAVATSVAGTRQREIFVTTMENYDQVAKYEQIASNSYGTAQEKMLAYTDSIEAAQKRYQNALEKFALALNRTNIIKTFYNSITFLAENAVALGTAFTTLALLVKGKEISNFFTEGIASLSVRAMNFGEKINTLTKDIGNGNLFSNIFSNIKQTIENVNESNLKEKYASELIQNTKGKLTETQQADWVKAQEAFIFNKDIDLDTAQDALTEALSAFKDTESIDNLNNKINLLSDTIDQYRDQLNNIDLEDEFDSEDWLEDLIENTQEELNSATEELVVLREQQKKEAMKTLLTDERYISIKDNLLAPYENEIVAKQREIEADLRASGQEDQLTNARRLAEQAVLEEKISEDMLEQVNNDLARRRQEPSAVYNMLTGLTVTGSSILGGIGVGNFGKQLFGDTGQVFGSMIGGLIATNATSGLMKGLASAEVKTAFASMMSGGGVSGLISAFSSAGVIGAAIAIAGVIGLSIWGYIEEQKKKKIEQQAKEFEEESNKYQEMLSASVDANKFDKLAKGVDKLGRNVSLTDDEYQEFLDLNTKLAEKFPGLISHTDGQGQAFVTASEGANTLTESINMLVEAQQRLADQSVLAPELFEQSYQDAKKEYDEAKKQLEEARKKSDFDLNEFNQEVKMKRFKWTANESDSSTIFTANSQEEYKNLIKFLKERKINYKASSISHGSHKEGTDWEEITGIKIDEKDVEKLDKILQEYNNTYKSQLTQLENNLESSRHILDTQRDTIYRELQQIGGAYNLGITNFDSSIFDAMNDEEKLVMSKLAGTIKPEYNNSKQYMQEFADRITEYHNYFNKDGRNFLKFYLELDDSKSGEEYSKIREKMAEELEKLYKVNEQGEELALNLASDLGYVWDNNNEIFKDTEDIFTTIVEQIREARNLSEKWTWGISKDEFNSKFSRREQQELAKMNNEGILGSKDDYSTLRRRINSRKYENSDKDSAENNLIRYRSLINDKQIKGSISSHGGGMEEYSSYLESMFDMIQEWGESYTAEDFERAFPDLDEVMANKFEALGNAIEDGTLTSAEAMEQAGISIINAMQDSIEKIAEINLEEIFQGADFEGFADSWKEFATMAEYTAKGLDRIKEAQEEYANVGRLGWKTTLDLLSANERYAEALDVVNGQVVFKTNAEDILARIEIQEAYNQTQLTLTNLEAELQEKANTLALLEKGETEISVADATAQAVQDNIDNNTLEAKSVVFLGSLYSSLGKIKLAAQRGEETGNILSAIGEATSAMNGISTGLQTKTTSTKTFNKSEIEKLRAEVGGIVYKNDKGKVIDSDKVYVKDGKLYYKGVTHNLSGMEVMGDVGVTAYSDGSGTISHQIEIIGAMASGLKEMLDSDNISRKDYYNWYDPYTLKKEKSGSGSKENPFKDELQNAVELAKMLDDLIDKEWEAMQIWDKNKNSVLGVSNAQNEYNEALKAYNDELAQIKALNVDLNKTKFGNIDTDTRQKLEWTTEALESNRKALESWGWTEKEISELAGSYSTVLGMWDDKYGNIPIAYTPMLNTENGPEVLNKSTFDKYMDTLLKNADSKNFAKSILDLDAQGFTIDGKLVKNLIASIGDEAEHVAETMHFVGVTGSLADITNWLKEAEKGVNSLDNSLKKLQNKDLRNLDVSTWLRSEYYDKKAQSLRNLIDATQEMKDFYQSDKVVKIINGVTTYWNPEETDDNGNPTQMTTKEYLEYMADLEKDLITYQKDLNNLDDEEIQDHIDLLELKKELVDFEDERLGVYADYNSYLRKEDDSYERQKANLEARLVLERKLLDEARDTEEEYFTYLKQVKQTEREIADLEYEQQESKIKILESVDASIEALIDAQNVLISQVRTQEEYIDAQNELLDLLQQERDLRKSILEFQKETAERSNKYYSATAYSNGKNYDLNYQAQMDSLLELQKIAQENLDAAYKKAAEQYLREVTDHGVRRWTDEEAHNKAIHTDDYINAYNEYMDINEQMGDLIYQRVQDRIAELEKKYDRVEKKKPDEWGVYGLIGEYGEEQVSTLNEQIIELRDALKDVDKLTDDQIQDLVDQLNDKIIALNEAKKNILQEEIDYKDNQFNALVDWIEDYIDGLRDLEDEIDDYYDDLLPKLEKELDDRRENAELLELENNLLKAREKTRVYRSGIGWVNFMPMIHYIG